MNSYGHDIPINVIILDDPELAEENLIEDYLDTLKGCRKMSEFRSLFKMFYKDVRTNTLREVLIRDIQLKASILESTKDENR